MNNRQPFTILYERLSRDDELQGPSNSILNQQRLLEEYADRNGLAPYEHVSDDGYSGTNFNRPGWQKLIAEIEAGKVSAVIFKDMSRMGRDYLRVGLYMEMFREKGVRLIAVNDAVDTAHGDDDFTPFRNIMAEWYPSDMMLRNGANSLLSLFWLSMLFATAMKRTPFSLKKTSV